MDPNKIVVVNKRYFSGSIVGWEHADVQYIGRPSRLGNPFTHKDGTTAQYKTDTVEEAVNKFHNYLREDYAKHGLTKAYIDDLVKSYKEGRPIVLVCWCADRCGLKVQQKPWKCHGQVIAHAIIKLAGGDY